MDIETNIMPIDLEIQDDAIIKVMGIGGGGCNAVNHMYEQGIEGVSLLVCNTDKQALSKSAVPAKLQLGPGLGAGGRPEKAQQFAEENRERIKEALNDGTQMLFITAGMGGGTGTGASPIVASVAKEMGILTVGIVTVPFLFEREIKMAKAKSGIEILSQNVDALLVINNEKLRQIYPDLNVFNAFKKADDVVSNAARAIAEIITIPGYINTDFADVYNTLKDGNVAIMNVGTASGENRITNAIRNALDSPLVNNDVHGAKRILLQFYCSEENAIEMQEIDQINAFIKEVGNEVEVQWGASVDDTLGDAVRVTIIATGYEVYDYIGSTEVEEKVKIESESEPDTQHQTLDTLEIPEEPEEQDEPETSEEPEIPEEPEEQDEPEQSEESEQPEEQDEPEQPEDNQEEDVLNLDEEGFSSRLFGGWRRRR